MKKKTIKNLLTIICGLIILNSYGAATFTITTTSVPDGNVQHPYSFKLQTSNAVGAVTWSKSGGTFPQGIQLGASSGVISGSVGTFTNTANSFTITATDAAGSQAIRAYSFSFTNLQIANTNFVRTGAQTLNARDANWYDYYDLVNNMYDLPAFTAGSGVTVSKPSTWNGIAPTYTISASGGSNVTSITGIGTVTVTGSAPSYTINSTVPVIVGVGSTTVTGTFPSYTITTPEVFSGVYTPTVIAQTNIASATPHQCQYMRVGNVVTGSCYFEITASGAGSSLLRVELPISSNLDSYTLGGGGSNTVADPLIIYGQSSTDELLIGWEALSGDPHGFPFTFTYLIQ